MISVITISRQVGCGGSEFAKRIAQLCDYRLIWREVINQAAIQIGAPEVALAMIDDLGLFGLCPDKETCEAYRTAIQDVMKEYADKGNVVIVGRASQIILKDNPKTLHIRVIANRETRIANLCRTKNISQQAALNQIKKSDANRQKYIHEFYEVDWNEPSLYDLTINTGRFPVEMFAQWISQLIKAG